LEVKGEEVFNRVESLDSGQSWSLIELSMIREIGTYEAMSKGENETCDIGAMVEKTHWHQRVFCDFLFSQEEEPSHQRAEDNQADDLGG